MGAAIGAGGERDLSRAASATCRGQGCIVASMRRLRSAFKPIAAIGGVAASVVAVWWFAFRPRRRQEK